MMPKWSPQRGTAIVAETGFLPAAKDRLARPPRCLGQNPLNYPRVLPISVMR
jgi:hypothetical protein